MVISLLNPTSAKSSADATPHPETAMKKILLFVLLAAEIQPALAAHNCETPEERAIMAKVDAELAQLDTVDAYLRERLRNPAGGLWNSELSTVEKLIEEVLVKASRLRIFKSKILIKQTNCIVGRPAR